MEQQPHHSRLRLRPTLWVPTVNFVEALPYVAVMSVSTIMYKRLGVSNEDIALYTSLLYLPWVIKCLWSPFIDLLKTKRWWILTTEVLLAVVLAGVAWSITGDRFFPVSLTFFWLMAFSSATHDIAADGFYMQELNSHEQSLFVGVRSLFYRFGTLLGQGALIMFAGELEVRMRQIGQAWSITFYILAATMLLFSMYHRIVLPRPRPEEEAQTPHTARQLAIDFVNTFVTFFTKKGAGAAIAFMLLYRLPEALLVKMTNLFLIDPVSEGGLGLSTLEVGWIQGTVGVGGLILGGLLGGVAIAHWGLKTCLWPMVASLTIPDLVYVYLAMTQTQEIGLISGLIGLEQFGYGFGFTAYMLYLIYYSRGKHETAHYAFCTGFMAASMMLPGMMAGYLQTWCGYANFFWLVMACCGITVGVTALLKIDPSFGKKTSKS